MSDIREFEVRLPSGDVLPIEFKAGPEMLGLAMKQFIEASLCPHGYAPLHADGIRIVHNNREITDETILSEFRFDSPPTAPVPVEVLVKMGGGSRVTRPRLFEYREFVRQISPADGATKVPLDATIHIVFGANLSGYCVSLAYLRDSTTCAFSSPDPLFGNMLAQFGNDSTLARERGFVQWSKEKYNQRVMLLRLDPATALKFFPPRRHHHYHGQQHEQPARRSDASSIFLDSKRYWDKGVNEGYIGGDEHSWQRYTSSPPVDAVVSETPWPVLGLHEPAFPPLPAPFGPPPLAEDEAPKAGEPEFTTGLGSAYSIADATSHSTTLSIRPLEPLQPRTHYAVLLMNSAPTVPVGDCLTRNMGVGVASWLSIFKCNSLSPSWPRCYCLSKG
jgi:hypothetical protein